MITGGLTLGGDIPFTNIIILPISEIHDNKATDGNVYTTCPSRGGDEGVVAMISMIKSETKPKSSC